ncbi:MAG: hypothetical protein QM771_08155 [Nitrospira sp.]
MMGPSEDVTSSAIAFKSPSQGFSIYQNAFFASGETILVFKAAEQVHLHMSKYPVLVDDQATLVG